VFSTEEKIMLDYMSSSEKYVAAIKAMHFDLPSDTVHEYINLFFFFLSSVVDTFCI
jgi:hypothetical protein